VHRLRPFFRLSIAFGFLLVLERETRAQYVLNNSFELDRFTKAPGFAIANNGICSWKCIGNVGINPLWHTPGKNDRPLQPFLDNGRIPDGRQTAFIQDIGVLSQSVPGLRKGAAYVIRYCENARRHRRTKRPPRLAVLAGDRVIVPDHAVRPVDTAGRFDKPYRWITSASFVVEKDSPLSILFLTSVQGGVTVYLDAVRIEAVPDGGAPPTPTLSVETASPVVLNGSFEADHFMRRPGYADANGGITAWYTTGQTGINPTWGDRLHDWGERSDFTDNGRVPDGRQAAFVQGAGVLRQAIPGFRAGRAYRVRYYENARATRGTPNDPLLKVQLGGETIVSAHSVPAIEPRGRHDSPYFRVESAPFIPLRSGTYELVFRALSTGPTTVLLDRITVERTP